MAITGRAIPRSLVLMALAGCSSEHLSESADNVEIEGLAERAKLSATGRHLTPGAVPLATLANIWSDALDLPAADVIDAIVTGPAQGSAIRADLGIIKPVRGNSFVLLSTGVAGSTAPEPGTDFTPAGPEGDTVTLTLDLRVPRGVTNLTLQYNFLSSEAPDFVGSIYNDVFSIQLIDAQGTRTFPVASVNDSKFFLVSNSRALGSGFDIYTANPNGVDNPPFDVGKPDAGLTGFHAFSAEVLEGADLRVVFTIGDAGDGVLDSAVLIDSLVFSAIETVDPNPELVIAGGELTGNLDALVEGGRHVRAAVADGVTPVLLRVETPGAGDVEFSLDGGTAPADGELSTVGGTVFAGTVTSPTVEVDGQHYALAVYRAPPDFSRGAADEHLIDRTVRFNASYLPDSGLGGFDSQVDLQIVRPPVVLTHGPWAGVQDWLELPITDDPRFSITYASYAYSCEEELFVVPRAEFQAFCPWQTGAGRLECGTDRTKAIGAATIEALENMRRLGIAATQVDIVAHGAGGVYARQHIGSGDYQNDGNLGRGDINRLITLNTPHFGSKLADAIVAARNNPLLSPESKDNYQCAARRQSLAPIEPGDIDDLTTENSSLNTTPVPSHAIVGTGGIGVTHPSTSTRKVGTRTRLYQDTLTHCPVKPCYIFNTNIPPPLKKSTVFVQPDGTLLDHDLFSDVDSQSGGLTGLAVSLQPMTPSQASTDETPDSDYFYALRYPPTSDKIIALLNSPVDGDSFGQFTASPALAPGPTEEHPLSDATSESATLATGSIHITSPSTEDEAFAGAAISVNVIAEDGFVPETVWLVMGGSIERSDTPPFDMEITVPERALGPVTLFAVGLDASGGMLISNDVILNVRTLSKLESVRIITQDPVLVGAGTRRRLSVIGHYEDGVDRDITTSTVGTAYETSNANVVTIAADGTMTAGGPGIATVIARHDGAQDSITVTVKAVNTRPIAICESPTSCNDPGRCVADITTLGAGSSDPEGKPILTSQSPAGPYAVGQHEVSVNVSDGELNAQCTSQLEVLDCEAPALSCPADFTAECTAGGGAVIEPPVASATDNCGGATVHPPVGGPMPLGLGELTYTAVDASGNGASCTTKVTVEDTIPPAITCPSPTVAECTGSGRASVDPGVGSATDTCTAATVINPGVGLYPLGTTPVTYAASDLAGNQGTCETTVTVQDTIPPSVTCPAPAVAECSGAGQAVVDLGAAAATDSCTAATVQAPGPSSYPLGTTPVTLAAQDTSGNQATCETSVTVQDTTAPSITCPGPVVAECAGPSGAFVQPGQASSSDLCTGVTVTGPSPGDYPLGTTVVTYTSQDATGHEASCASSIQVVDTTPPLLSLTAPDPLWPDDHHYRTIRLSDCKLAVVDACGGTLSPSAYQASITCVTSDEPDNAPGGGDGNTTNDMVIVNSTTVRLRSERHDAHDGRIYKIHFQVQDAAGNLADGVCPVIVPEQECKKPKDDDEPVPECVVGDSGVAHQVCQ